MTQLSGLRSRLDAEFADIAAASKVPGAAFALYYAGETVTAATGVTSTATGVAVDDRTVFQIGSITKLWTATLVMQLVDDGLVDLDQPLQRYLPEFSVADQAAAAAITPRQLLVHTAGFEGELFDERGRGDDATELYVKEVVSQSPQLFAPGAMFSYNNAAFAVAGRLAEVVRGQPFRTLLAERIAGPLGLESVSPSPYEAILWRAAVGHIPIGPEGAEVPTPQWALAPATAPAGAMLAMTATDLVGFGRAHLGDGLGANGIRILSAESARAMRAPQAELPAINGVPSARGLGFGLTTSADPLVAGHNGGTIGQTSFFRIVPGHDLAIALLTNGGDPIPLYQAAVEQTITELTGAQFPAPPAPPAEPYPVNPAGWLGTYANTVTQVELAQAADGSLIVTLTPKGIEAEIGGQVESAAAVGYDERSLITAEPFHGLHATLTFLGDDGQGRTPYLYVGGRILPRL